MDTKPPLGLNLGGYSGFQLNFQGIATSQSLIVVITVWPHSGGYYGVEVGCRLTGMLSPWLSRFQVSVKEAAEAVSTRSTSATSTTSLSRRRAEAFASFGITSFQAIN